ncbi:hypothetical protein D1872_144520 [compost metagenome]
MSITLIKKKPLFQIVNEFWDQNKNAPCEKRNEIAQTFINELLTEGITMRQLQTLIRMRHPSIRIKDKRHRFTLLEIVADFILDIKMIPERKEEYPISNAEAQYYRERQRKEMEVSYEEYFEEKDWNND